MEKIYLLSGSIGVGKSTILEKLKKTKKYEVVTEFDLENPLIKKIISSTYGKKKIDQSVMQMFTFANRLMSFELSKKRRPLFVDRSPLDPLIFNKLLGFDKHPMHYAQLNLLREYLQKYKKQLKIIYFDLEPEAIIERIVERNRENEKITRFTYKMILEWQKHLLDVCRELGLADNLVHFNIQKNWTAEQTFTHFKKFFSLR